jgi:hypothetical protein
MTAKKRLTKAEREAAQKAAKAEAVKKRLAELPAPGEQTKVAIAHATAANKGRRRRVQANGEMEDGTLVMWPSHSHVEGWSDQFQNAFGSTSEAFYNQTLAQVTAVTREFRQPQTIQDTNTALAVMDGIQPRDEIEAMLAAQMAATHNVAMHMLHKAKHAEYLEHMNSFGGLATKLLRTFTAQTEALAKLRRGGEQTVRVEHVHVHSGGQAIVGNVNHAGGGGGLLENQNQPHAKALSHAPQSPLWGENPEREPVPVTGNAER